MILPENAALCIRMLEAAGHEAYAVGGCVRDSLLGLTPHDYDLCTNALPGEICRVFGAYPLIRNGEKHGTVGVVMDGQVYEITTFRTEGDYTDNRHPGWVRFVPDIRQDLARRDFTVNAMAYSPKTGYVDPWGGQQDLRDRVLRAVGDPDLRFTEDSLRILRGVRFAVRYGLTPEPETLEAMTRLAPLMDNLARERVFDELCKLLILVTAQDLLRFAPILAQAIPELAPTIGFDQRTHHHAYDVYTHTAHVVAQTPPNLPLRWAALLHDIGKPRAFSLDESGTGHFKGHAQIGADMADQILLRLKAPTALRQQVVFLVEKHMLPPEPDKKVLRRRLGKHGQEAVCDLLALQRADLRGKGTGLTEDPAFRQVEVLLEEISREDACLTVRDLAVTGNDILALGIPAGPRVGAVLEQLLEQVQDEIIPNEKSALLSQAEKYR